MDALMYGAAVDLLSEHCHPELLADEFNHLQGLPSPGSIGCVALCKLPANPEACM